MGNQRPEGNAQGLFLSRKTVCLHNYTIILLNIGFSFSVLPALSLTDGILHCDIVEGSFDAELFGTFISRLLDFMEPFPATNSVIVMDNCRIHKNPEILDLITERYAL
jgi:hypothetical protein